MQVTAVLIACLLAGSCQALSGSNIGLKLNNRQGLRITHALKSTLEPTLEAAAEPLDVPRTATVTSSTFSLAKGILGAGLLTLPSGIAAFSDKRSALVPATVILAGMGLLSAYSFKSIARICEKTGSRSLNEAWSHAVNKESAPWVSFVVAFKTVFTCLTYSIVIGDSFTDIFRSVGVAAQLATRSNVILATTALVIFPLCLQQRLDALKYTSIIGMIGTLYCPIFMSWRFFDGSYAAGGKFAAEMAANLQPSFNVQAAQNPLLVFKLLTMVSTAYVAHYSAPAFQNELVNPTKKRFNRIVSWGFGVSFIAMLVAMYIGFLTFGGNAAGFVLNNYATSDMFANVARVAVGLGVLFGYPLIFTALREGSFDLLGANAQQRNKYNVPFTASILAAVTSVALVVRNLGSVVSFSGALTGSALIYITPALMNLSLQQKEVSASGSPNLTRKQKVNKVTNYGMLIFGALCSIVGVGIFTAGM